MLQEAKYNILVLSEIPMAVGGGASQEGSSYMSFPDSLCWPVYLSDILLIATSLMRLPASFHCLPPKIFPIYDSALTKLQHLRQN